MSKQDKVVELRNATFYKRATASAALNTIITPAANTNGLIVRYFSMDGSSVGLALGVKTSAPASYDDMFFLGLVTADRQACITPIFVPAGYGLYEQASSNGATSRIAVMYEVL